MGVECDIRDAARPRTAGVASALGAGAKTASDLPEAARLRGRRRNAFTGTRAVLAAPETGSGSLVERALACVAGAVKATESAPLDFVPDAQVCHTSAGTAVVHLHQHHRGIPVYESVRSVRFEPGGAARDIVGDHVALSGEIDILPAISAADAVLAAARYLAGAGVETGPEGEPLAVSHYRPRTLASFALPSRPTLLVKRPFAEPVTAHLVLLYCAHGDVRLGWLVSLTLPGQDDEYDLIVAAQGAGEVLYCKGSYCTARGRGRVFRHNPDDTGGRSDLDLPRPRDAYPAFDAATPGPSFGRPWVADDRTRGNNAASFRGNRRRDTLRGAGAGGAVVFAPNDSLGEEQQLLNSFYFCNYLHDFFSLLGFGEAEGSFQRENFSGAPGDRDELDVRVFRGPVAGLARMRSRRDGRRGQMHLGIREDPDDGQDGEARHTALDSDIVYHEYAHGVSSRLAGGRLSVEPLRHPESRALAEGYSDYFALTIRSWQTGEEQAVFGAWLSGNQVRGLRRHAYTDDFPLHYGDLTDPDNQSPHEGGEIWCAALMGMDRALGQDLGDADRAHEIGWRMVVDSLKLLPVGPDKPGFLDARDALVRALEDLGAEGRISAAEHAAAERALWQAFARTGMGPGAQGQGARFQGIVADFTMPDQGGSP